MLLLVLILVLIAFGLLVVALLSGSVLWAWVSVGVSVAAAAVLLVDWLQRRSAVRAGAEAGDAMPTPLPGAIPPPHGLGREPVVEPATEIFPVVRADAPQGPPAEVGATAPDGRDERPDPQETVVLRALAPPGSAEGPSGARDGIAPSRPISSQSVTGSGNASGSSERRDAPSQPPAGAPSGTAAPDADAEATVQVSGASTPRDEPSGAPVDPGSTPLRGAADAPEGSPPGGVDRRPDLPPMGPDGAPPEEPHDADATGLVAELDDEVVVVDELPRYHLNGCPSLAGSPLIPLPAREAVELGFTPCAWCTPNRTLSSRHRAAAR